MATSNGTRNGAMHGFHASSTKDSPKDAAARRRVVPTAKSAVRRAGQSSEDALRAVQGQAKERPLLTLGLCAAGAFTLGAILRPRLVGLAALIGAGYTAWRLSDGRVEQVIREGAGQLGLLSAEED